MTVGGNQYNEADLLRMQHDAEARVRDMQRRARETVEEGAAPEPRHRGWNQSSGMRRPSPGVPLRRPPPPRPEREERPAPPPPEAAPAPPRPAEQQQGTVLGDIMSALRLDEDYLLIVGLILILLNQRGDPLLILALAYLLI